MAALASGLTLVGNMNMQATVTADLTLGNVSKYADYGFTADIPGGTLKNNEIIGIYSFAVDNISGGNLPGINGNGSTLWSICLSPGGLLDGNKYNYALETYADAKPGLNPSAWALGTEGDAGIQNAQYLWRKYGAGILAGGANQDAGAALALAMYDALYNSTAYGTLGGNKFTVTGWGGHTGAQTDFNNYIAGLNADGVKNNLAQGFLLVPTPTGGYGNNGNNQEFIINCTPVPEPTTMIAGALLLLPFGLSTFRILRRNRMA